MSLNLNLLVLIIICLLYIDKSSERDSALIGGYSNGVPEQAERDLYAFIDGQYAA